MKEQEENLIKLLSAAISDNETVSRDDSNFNWQEIIDEAKAHSVKALIYSGAKKLKLLDTVPKNILEPWKKESIFTGISEKNHIREVSRILQKFNEESIPVIVLKGLVVRDFYPTPDFRTMGDADILVHDYDLEKVGDILCNLGYLENVSSREHGAHRVFYKEGFRRIEVHWTLINEDIFIGTKEFENNIWQNVIQTMIGKVEILSLSYEDLAMHLCIHMAGHIAGGGFGLRQLCDLVVLYENKKDEISWSSFYHKGKELRAEKFIIAIFICCKRLFNMEIPREVEENSFKVNDTIIDNLIKDIFYSGLFGKRHIDSLFGGVIAYNKGKINKDKNNLLKRFVNFIFPRAENMSEKYNYAKKNKILLPIAWIHHVFSGIFSKKFTLKDKTRFITSTVSTAKKREELLKHLELIE